MADSTITIRCRHVCKKYDDVPAVCHVDLDVHQGRFLALLGPSGCGKTTVLRLMAGLEVPTGGEIEISGELVSGPNIHVPPERRKIGMVFQEYALFPHMSVFENIHYGLRNAPSPAERGKEVLELVGLQGLGDRMPHELSGGQQQRVALARALAPKPDVILLDEPFSNLDAALRVRVRADVRQILRDAQVTAVFVTHDQEEALSLADEIAVMMEGRILQTARPQDLYRRPATHQVATFLGEANFLPGEASGKSVECELGTLLSEVEEQGEVELMFRPEELELQLDPEGCAEVVDVEYFGHDRLIKLRLESGTTLRSRLVGRDGKFKEGTKVSLHVEGPVMVYPSKFGCPVIPAP